MCGLLSFSNGNESANFALLPRNFAGDISRTDWYTAAGNVREGEEAPCCPWTGMGRAPVCGGGDLAEATLEGAFRDLPSCVAEILKVTGVVFNATLVFEEKL